MSRRFPEDSLLRGKGGLQQYGGVESTPIERAREPLDILAVSVPPLVLCGEIQVGSRARGDVVMLPVKKGKEQAYSVRDFPAAIV